jgi:formylglycine-generating enzyme required for sulfatase activity
LVVGGAAIVLGVTRAQRAKRLDAEARATLARGDLPEAALLYDEWVALDPDSVAAREGRETVQALRRLREAEGAFREARGGMEEVRLGERRLDLLRRRAAGGRTAPGGAGLGTEEARGSEPWWMREPAYRAGVEARREAEALAERRARVANRLAEALSNAEAAHERAGAEGARVRASIREAAAAWHVDEWRRSIREGDREAAAVHALAVQSLDPAPHEAELRGDGALVLRTAGRGEEAWIFRYERESDVIPRGGPRLVPLPFDLARRAVDVPPAYAEAVRARLEGEDPDAVQADTPCLAEPFPGTETHLGTMDGPLLRARYDDTVRGSAYPCVVGPANALPLRPPTTEVPLPMGSYLLLLRAPGSADVRIPFAVGRNHRVALDAGDVPRAGEVPPGFVRVVGRDHLGPFLASRHEVTYGEWWEFLSDPRTREESAKAAPDDVRWVPRIEGQPLSTADERGVFPLPVPPELPVAGVSLFDVAGHVAIGFGEARPRDDQLQALAAQLRRSGTAGWGYLEWRTERSRARARDARAGGEVADDVVVVERPDGTREYRAMRFSLPTVEEWEWMAGGADGRAFPYGEEREWLAFKGARSRRSNPVPEPIGLFPDDESVFGVRDLAGGVSEWTCDWKEVGGLFWVKGSSWASQEPDGDRILSRVSLAPDATDAAVGLRVVVRETEPVE